MCIISGCDYLDRLPKCGLKTVHKQFKKLSNVDRGIKAFISNHNMKNVGSIDTKDYYEKFREVSGPCYVDLNMQAAGGYIKNITP
jgi:5'-3' exonuclease